MLSNYCRPRDKLESLNSIHVDSLPLTSRCCVLYRGAGHAVVASHKLVRGSGQPDQLDSQDDDED